MSVTAKNPILPGFYPDPTFCAVGDDYYIVNSSFSYFPGLPILHSKDLAHWEQIGNVLDRASQLPLKNSGVSRGLFAPTLRFHDGKFYCICTNVSFGGNFIVTAENPEGPWSEPVYIKDADGIDPSIFFDDDGKMYYTGTHPNPEGEKHNGDWYIYVQEMDRETFQLIGEPHNVWNGAMRNVIWPEGPHLFKKDGYYYIMHAEGGTGPDHCESICRSENVYGPFVGFPKNPIITHRHLGKNYPIQYVGHADMIETSKGEFFMIMLAVRPLETYTTMGRETFIAKVEWEDGWPVVNPGVGMLTDTVEIDLDEWIPEKDASSFTSRTESLTRPPFGSKKYDFTKMTKLGCEFMAFRNPKDTMYKLSDKGLELNYDKCDLTAEDEMSFLCIRQQHHSFDLTTEIALDSLKDEYAAGITVLQNNLYNLRVEVKGGNVSAVLCQDGKDEVKGSATLKEVADADTVKLEIRIRGLKAELYAGDKKLGEANVKNLSTEVAGGFVGCTVGLYANAGGSETSDYASFRTFEYIAG